MFKGRLFKSGVFACVNFDVNFALNIFVFQDY